ncbi:hypothetical protein Cadr_000019756 [Camelus dromedarius]|uniref:Uncharacterized protein n=1 Tax=Camelus dromedarius TaxID=9838 RepID=A0A5N4D5W6_CAMDR|nr:hypothetical protein Cadr_000019756 [Camelus dromedarius]
MRRVGGTDLQYNHILYPEVGDPRTGDSEPHFGSPAQSPAPERQALRALGFEGQWGLTAGAPQDWGNRDFMLKGRTPKPPVHQDPGQKKKFDRSLGQVYLLVSEMCGYGSPRGPRSWWQTYWGTFGPATVLECLRPNHLTALRHSPTHQQTGCLKTKQPSGLAPRHDLAHQRAPAPPTRKPDKHLDQPHPPGVRQQKQRNHHPATTWALARSMSRPVQPQDTSAPKPSCARTDSLPQP